MGKSFRHTWVNLPSTSDVSNVTLAAFLLPAGRFIPILSNFSLSDRPPFLDLALKKGKNILFLKAIRQFGLMLILELEFSVVVSYQHTSI